MSHEYRVYFTGIYKRVPKNDVGIDIKRVEVSCTEIMPLDLWLEHPTDHLYHEETLDHYIQESGYIPKELGQYVVSGIFFIEYFTSTDDETDNNIEEHDDGIKVRKISDDYDYFKRLAEVVKENNAGADDVFDEHEGVSMPQEATPNQVYVPVSSSVVSDDPAARHSECTLKSYEGNNYAEAITHYLKEWSESPPMQEVRNALRNAIIAPVCCNQVMVNRGRIGDDDQPESWICLKCNRSARDLETKKNH